MYSEPGNYIADFCVVRKSGIYHLFHIHGDRGGGWLGSRDFGHAVSEDLYSWTPLDSVIPTGPTGSWDGNIVFAPHVVEKGGVYYMLYTGLDDHWNQKIGLATSTDLFEWEKYSGNPVVEPQKWSDRNLGVDKIGLGATCRDPMVFEDTSNSRYLMYYTAAMEDRRPCIAVAQSEDLVTWDDFGPTYVEDDMTYNRLESPFICENAGQYYLFYSGKGGPKTMGANPDDFSHFEINYLVSKDPTGQWHKPRNHKLLEEWCAASEHPTVGNATYALFIAYESLGGRWRGSKLSDPYRIRWSGDGTAEIVENDTLAEFNRSVFDGDFVKWTRCRHDPGSEDIHSRFEEQDLAFSSWVISGDCVESNCVGDSYLMSPNFVSDMRCEVEIVVEDDSAGSIVIRSNQHGTAGYLVCLDYGRRKIGFYRTFHGEAKQLIQERDADIALGQLHKIKAIAKGKFVEVYLDDVLSMVRADDTYQEGFWGLHASGRGVRFSNIIAEECIK